MLEIRVIGELEVRLAGTRAELPAGRRVRSLLGWLVVHPGRHPRSRLAGQFWPDVLETSARASLRSAIWALRSALGPDFGSCLVTDRDTVTLVADGVWIDLREVRLLIARGQPAAALDLCRGDLLQELDDDWVVQAREELDRDLAAALRDLAHQAAAVGDPAAAAAWARRRAALCPLDESAGADLIRALIQAGDAPAALAALARLRDQLQGELGVDVSPATAALASGLRRPGTGAVGAVSSVGDADVHGGPTPAEHMAGPAADLVGRDADFARLAGAWEAARNGAGGTVLVEGEGGIGKTRLVEELLCAVRRAAPDATVITAATSAGPGRDAPFGIWTDALSDLVRLAGRPPASAPWSSALARVVPALALARAGADAATGAGGDPQLERVRLCEAVVELVAWASGRAPLLLTFEDLHQSDAASLELIAYVGRRLGRLPVLLVLTRRLLPSRLDLDAVCAALRSRGALVAEITVAPLPDVAARALVEASADLPSAAVTRIVTMAAGSPLLAVEIARATARDDAHLAAGLGGAARLAVGRLSGQARVFVEFLAAAGRDLDRPEIASLPLRSPALAAAEALGSGLLRADGGAVGFRHALLREAVYLEIPDPIRARLHGEIAQLLRKRGRPPQSGAASARGSRRGPRAAEIARHLILAGQDEQAVSHLVMAAHDARTVAATTEAAAFLTEATAIEPHDPDLLVELAEVEAFRGRLEFSDRAFDRALEEIPPQDAGALISAWLRRGRWLRGGICHPRESRRSYQSALDVLDWDPSSDVVARAEALAGLAWAEAVAGDPEEVDRLLARADRVLGGDRPGDLLTHDIGVARGHALIRAGRFTDSFAPLIAASAAAGRAGRPDMSYSCLSNAASAAACAGEFSRALDFADRCVPLVTPNGLLRLGVYAQTARSAILRRLGRLPEASQACDAAAGLSDRAGLPELDGLVAYERGLVALAAADPAAAATSLAEALDLRAPVSRTAARLRRAEALALSGQPEVAECELREAALEPVGSSDFPPALVAQMSRVQALIASARGDAALAERRLAESVACWERIAGTLDGAQTGTGYVAALIDLGRPPVSSLVEPARELAVATAELSALHDSARRE